MSTLLTSALFFSNSDDLVVFCRSNRDTIALDVDLVQKVLNQLQPTEAASVLWSPIGYYLPENLFNHFFLHIYAVAKDDDTLHQLGGALYDYLRFHSKGAKVPDQLARHLMSLANAEARIVGLKLLRISTVPREEYADALHSALQSDDLSERYGGIFQIGLLLDDPQLSLAILKKVRETLRALEATDTDEYIRDTSRIFGARIDDSIDEGAASENG